MTRTQLKTHLNDSSAVDLVESFFPKYIKDDKRDEAAAVILSNFKKHKDALVEALVNETDDGKHRATYDKVINSWDLVTIGLIAGGVVLGIVLIGGIAFFL